MGAPINLSNIAALNLQTANPQYTQPLTLYPSAAGILRGAQFAVRRE